MLAVNAWDEDRETIRRFVEEKGLVQRMLLGGAAVHETYGLVSIPVSVWIDRAGIIRDVDFGFDGPAGLEDRTKRFLEGS